MVGAPRVRVLFDLAGTEVEGHDLVPLLINDQPTITDTITATPTATAAKCATAIA